MFIKLNYFQLTISLKPSTSHYIEMDLATFYRGGSRSKLSSTNLVNIDGDDYLVFQALCWSKLDKTLEDEGSGSDEAEGYDYGAFDDDEPRKKSKSSPKSLFLRVFGLTQEGQTVSLEIKGFQPYFYLKIPTEWGQSQLSLLINRLASHVPNYRKTEVIFHRSPIISKSFFFFDNYADHKFLKISFKSEGARWDLLKALMDDEFNQIDSPTDLRPAMTKEIVVAGRKFRFPFFESQVDSIIRFIDISEIKPTGWIKVNRRACQPPMEKTQSQLNFTVQWDEIKHHDKSDIAPFRISSFDIECTSCDGSFPQAKRRSDAVIQIGTTTRIYGSKYCQLRHIICLKDCDDIPDIRDDEKVIVESYQTEREVLLAWTKHVQLMDPDVVIGYNIFGFDWKYLYDRAEMLNCQNFFSRLGRMTGQECKLIKKNLSSSAMGFNQLHYPDMKGRLQIDLLKVVQREHNLPNYKLDSVAYHFLKLNKNDLPPDQIFERYKTGSSQDIKVIAEYCLQDCVLVNDLFDKLNIFANAVGMSNVCYVPMTLLFTRGQGIKVFSLLSKTCRKADHRFPALCKLPFGDGKKHPGYEGAIVFDPIPGLYFDAVAVLDYKSLYPSSEIEFNISHETYVVDEKYLGLPGYRYNEIEFDIKNEDGKKVGVKKCVFAEKMKEDGSTEKGIVPRLLEELLAARSHAKKLKKKAKGTFMEAVYDGLQLAYKVTCNSVYGYFGAKFSDLRCQDLAAATTAGGRLRLYFASNEAEKFGVKVVYGDSVSPKTPLLLRRADDTITIKTIDSLVRTWSKPCESGKLYGVTTEPLEVWTDQGWTAIQTVMKHKVQKKMFRVVTHTGLVDVTEDHSLIRDDGKEVSPNNLKIGTPLLHSFPDVPRIKLDDGSLVFDHKDQLGAMKRFYDLQASGRYVTIDEDENNIYLDLHDEPPKNPNTVRKIYELPSDWCEEVYDLTTENHHFHAGVGQMIVHNTDSIFIDCSNHPSVKGKKGKEMLEATIELGKEIAEAITNQLRYPQELEYEKTFWPFLIISKKRYAGHLYEFNPNEFKFKSMGLVTKRRDNAPIVKKIYQNIMDILFNEQDVKKAVIFYVRAIKDLLQGNVPIEDLVVSKTLSANYANPTRVSHKVLAEKIKDRDPGNAPASNERIPYVFIDSSKIKCHDNKCKKMISVDNCKCKACMYLYCVGHLPISKHTCQPRCRMCWDKVRVDDNCQECEGSFCKSHRTKHRCDNIKYDALQGDLMETPSYIQQNNISIDYRYYLEHQIMKPVQQIFDLIEETKGVNILRKLLVNDDHRKNKTRSITSFFGGRTSSDDPKIGVKSKKEKRSDEPKKSLKITSFFRK